VGGYLHSDLPQVTVCSAHAAQGLLEIIAAATEFDELPMRPGEDEAVRKLLTHSPVAMAKPKYTDPHTKAHALMQASAP
jgi:pre-mRNA-splicing helicase BRR2